MSRKYFVEAEPMELELPPPLPVPTADPSLRGVESIKISAIRPNPSQPRVTFEPASLSALADSIAQHGIIQPLTVRRTDRLGEYELVAGERRLRAASIAGLSEVPCIVCEIDRRRSAYLAIIENIQRSDLDNVRGSGGDFLAFLRARNDTGRNRADSVVQPVERGE